MTARAEGLLDLLPVGFDNAAPGRCGYATCLDHAEQFFETCPRCSWPWMESERPRAEVAVTPGDETAQGNPCPAEATGARPTSEAVSV